MKEVFSEKGEQLPPAEAIAQAFYEWLGAEVNSSRRGRNAELDIIQPNNGNDFAGGDKYKNHYSHLQLWTNQFIHESHDEYMTARQLFAVQMELSGLFRIQCFVVAANNEERYKRARFESDQPLGINVDQRVNARLVQHFGKTPTLDELAQEVVGLDDLAAVTHKLNEDKYQYLKRLDASDKPNIGLRKLATLMHLHNLQANWLGLGTDYILFAAQQRGGQLANVPFLQPKSISDKPQVRYPFRDPNRLED